MPANPAPADLQAPAAHPQPAVNPGTGNLAFGAGDLSNPVLHMANPFGGPVLAPQAANPFATVNAGVASGQAQPAPARQGPASVENVFDWLDKVEGTGRYAGFTADGDVIPRIFGQTDSPASLNQGPAAGGPAPAPQAPLQAPPGPVPNGPIPAHGPQPYFGPMDPPSLDNPFFAVPDGGLPETPNPFFDIPDAGMPPTPSAVDKAKVEVAHQTEMHLFCSAMHELVLQQCVKQGLSPDAVKGLLDFYSDHSVKSLQESQRIGTAAGLIDSAAPLDIQAMKVLMLASRADAKKEAELTKLKRDKKRSARHDHPTFDPLIRKNGHKGSQLKRSEMDEYVGFLSDSKSGSDSDSKSIKTQLSQSYETISDSRRKIPTPRPRPTGDPDKSGDSSYDEDVADSSTEESITTSQETIEMSATEEPAPAPLSKTLPKRLSNQKQNTPAKPVVTPPPVKPQPVKSQDPKTSDRLAKQAKYLQDDLAKAGLKKNGQLRADLIAEQSLAIADLERQLKQITDPKARQTLLLWSKEQQDKRHTQAVNEWSRLHVKEQARTATADELAQMEELDIRSLAALDHVKAIRTLAANTYRIAL